ncbi:MAG: hypothetical protein L0Y72_29135 [Gemmataceae bacterium]|nr:hypothetical protein [Gemmataceae bacterium]MCI0743112.1 hypothetical protein [Gemmataceae bacterium]
MDWIKGVFLLIIVAAWIVKHFMDQQQEKARKQQERPAPPPPPQDADREGSNPTYFPEERIEHPEMTYEEVRRPTRKTPPKSRPKPPPLPPEVLPRPKPDIAETLSRLGTRGKKEAQATVPPRDSQDRRVGTEAVALPKSPLALPPEASSRLSEFEKRLEKAASALSPLPTAANSPVLSSVVRPPVPQAVQKLHQLLRDRNNLRVAFLLREIFDPPLAKRHRRT